MLWLIKSRRLSFSFACIFFHQISSGETELNRIDKKIKKKSNMKLNYIYKKIWMKCDTFYEAEKKRQIIFRFYAYRCSDDYLDVVFKWTEKHVWNFINKR